MTAELIKKGWLKRAIRTNNSENEYLITYNGRGFGSECVTVNDDECTRYSVKSWFVPSFELANSLRTFRVEVRIWPWLAIRSLYVYLNDDLLYKEGKEPYQVSALTELGNLAASWTIFIGPVIAGLGLLEYFA